MDPIGIKGKPGVHWNKIAYMVQKCNFGITIMIMKGTDGARMAIRNIEPYQNNQTVDP